MSARTSVVLLTLTLLLSLPGFGQDEALRVRVRVYDYARLGRDTLDKAQGQAARLLLQAGVQSEWVSCRGPAPQQPDPRCEQPIRGADVVLRILTRDMAARFHKPKDILAFSAVDPRLDSDHNVWMFSDSIRHLGEQDATFAQVLGHVEAHELGHFLMHDPGHSQAGIMRAHWSRNDLQAAAQGRLLFSAEQAERMRMGLGRRLQLAQVTP